MYKLVYKKTTNYLKTTKVIHFILTNTQPLPTDALEPYEILSYRDKCYKDYHNHKNFSKELKKNMGEKLKILSKCRVNLKRKIIEDAQNNK